jgi:sortase A
MSKLRHWSGDATPTRNDLDRRGSLPARVRGRGHLLARPVTDVYTRYQQHKLSGQLDREFEAWRPVEDPGNSIAARASAVAQEARRFQRRVRLGQPLGRIEVPKLGVHAVFVQGTRWTQDLTRGPGHYERTSFPGLGKTVGIAGHRTTFGAPFRHIDRLDPGDAVVLQLPYGTFRYRVFAHEIVDSDDWSVIRKRGFDTVMLSACHPLYGSSQRWIVYGRLIEVKPRGGEAFALAAGATTSG